MEASKFIFVYILMMPTIAHALVALLRIEDRGLEQFDKKFKFFVGAAAFGIFLMLVSVFFFIHWIEGLVCLGVVLVLIYAVW